MAKNNKQKAANPPRMRTAQAAPRPGKSTVVRRFASSQQVHTDIFKLSLAFMKKHIGWLLVDDKAHWEDVEHCHFFYTVNKKGEFSQYSTPTGDHFHEVKLVVDDKGKAILDGNGFMQVTVGPAIHRYTVKENERKVARLGKVLLFSKDGQPVYDEHTHQGLYIRSGKATLNIIDPTMAAKAADIRAAIEAREPQFPGGVAAV